MHQPKKRSKVIKHKLLNINFFKGYLHDFPVNNDNDKTIEISKENSAIDYAPISPEKFDLINGSRNSPLTIDYENNRFFWCKVYPDGNCFFRSLSIFFDSNQENHYS